MHRFRRRTLTCVLLLAVLVAAPVHAGCRSEDTTTTDDQPPSTLQGRYTELLEQLAPDVLDGSETLRQGFPRLQTCVATIGSPACSLEDLGQVPVGAEVAGEMRARIDSLPSRFADPDDMANASRLLRETSSALRDFEERADRFVDGRCSVEGFDIVSCSPLLGLTVESGREVERLLVAWEGYAT